MENSKNLKGCISNIFTEIVKSNTENIKVEKYEEILCDYIENLIHETEEKERVKCFGGNCVISVGSNSKPEKNIFTINNENETALKEYVNSEVTLYFKDINDKWLNQKLSGRLEIKKFDLADEGTKDFISRIKSGEKMEHKIDL